MRGLPERSTRGRKRMSRFLAFRSSTMSALTAMCRRVPVARDSNVLMFDRVIGMDIATIASETPRVYLDTAILHSMADRIAGCAERNDLPTREDAQSFIDAMKESGSVLLLSHGHLVDVADADEQTWSRFVGVLECFPLVGAIVHDPFAGQHHALQEALGGRPQTPPWDLTIVRLPSIGELFSAAQMASARSIARQGERIHDGRLCAALYGRSDEKLKKHAPQLAMQLLDADTEDALALLIHEWNDRFGLASAVAEISREELKNMVSFTQQLKQEVSRLARLYGLDVRDMLEHAIACPESAQLGFAGLRTEGGFDRWLETARVAAPGMYLAAKLMRYQVRNTRRNPRTGDRMDFFHTFAVPFADVATTDRANYPALSEAMSKVQSRCGVVLRNPGSNLSGLIEAVRALGR